MASLDLYADVFRRRGRYWREQRLATLDSAFQFSTRPHDLDDANEGTGGPYEPDWDMARYAFLRLFTAILIDYKRFLVLPEDEEAPAPGTGGGLNAAGPGSGFGAGRRRPRFDSKGFVENHYMPDAVPLLEQMVDTQAFVQFVDERLAVEAANSVGAMAAVQSFKGGGRAAAGFPEQSVSQTVAVDV